MKIPVHVWMLAAMAAGVAMACWVIGRDGLDAVIHAAAGIGIPGFVGFCLYSAATALFLGGAWVLCVPGLSPWRHLLLFTGARLVREGAADLLPFSQLGGLVVGARVLIARGHRAAQVNAAMAVDITTEMAAQVVFTLFGIAGLAALGHGGSAGIGKGLLGPLLLGAGAMVALSMVFLVAQRWILMFAARMVESHLPAVGARLGDVAEGISQVYRQRKRVLGSFLCNLGGWLTSAAGAWLALELMGIHLALGRVLVLESLIFTVRSVGFLIPGALGVQEAAYAMLAPLVGLSSPAALGLSLVKRARDLVQGGAALLGWQWSEFRKARALTRTGQDKHYPGGAANG